MTMTVTTTIGTCWHCGVDDAPVEIIGEIDDEPIRLCPECLLEAEDLGLLDAMSLEPRDVNAGTTSPQDGER